jgi:hypothetical protein
MGTAAAEMLAHAADGVNERARLLIGSIQGIRVRFSFRSSHDVGLTWLPSALVVGACNHRPAATPSSLSLQPAMSLDCLKSLNSSINDT